MARKQAVPRLEPAVPERESLKVHGDKLADSRKRARGAAGAKQRSVGRRSGGK